MDDITVIVDETIQDITVEVVTTGITTDQANQIIVNKNNADASKVVTDFISVTQAVNLDTIESDTSTNNAKITYPSVDSTKVGFISVTQAVDLDTIETNINASKVVTDFISITQAVNLDTIESDTSTNNAKISFDSTSSTRLANTSGTNTGDQDLSVKVDKVTGYSLTKNDLTDILKTAYDNTVTWITTNGTNLINHLTNTSNPHAVTKAQVGLGNVANTDLTSAVGLNTAKVGITPTQASNITTNNAKITYPSVDSTKVGFISVTQAVDLDTIESDTATNNAKITYPSVDSTKVGFISVTQAVDLDTIETDTATNNAKITYPSIDSTKVGFISVTQAVNLDTIETDTATNNAKVSDINHVTADLPNVDNTSDINKPVSTATQSALDLKVDITDATITTTNIFKSVSFTMDFSDRVVADSGVIESRNCVMNEYLKILN
tara:strand:- start:282 stop:1595 length:1314 start_codon:yes stop_codon:yes gene_type:complete